MPRSVCNVGDWTDSGISSGKKKNLRGTINVSVEAIRMSAVDWHRWKTLVSSGCSRSQGGTSWFDDNEMRGSRQAGTHTHTTGRIITEQDAACKRRLSTHSEVPKI